LLAQDAVSLHIKARRGILFEKLSIEMNDLKLEHYIKLLKLLNANCNNYTISDCYRLDRDNSWFIGQESGKWHVQYYERGQSYDFRSFENESDAAAYFFIKVVSTDTSLNSKKIDPK
jgi:hypothetical protein